MARGPIDAPRARAARLSLVQSAVTPDLTPEDATRWQLGYRFAPESCGDAWIDDPCAPQPGFDLIPVRPPVVEGEPFLVRAGDKCSALGWSAQDYEGRAQRLLQNCESKQIARELWTGTLAQAAGWPNPRLADPDADTVTTGPSGIVDVLACLEQALAECACGVQGMIHATRQLVTHWAALGPSVLRMDGGLLTTVHGTVVVSDAGYDGSSPAGVPAGASQWAYATGMVTVLRGPIEVLPGSLAEALDRADNTVAYYAQRPATVTWDGCCHFAAEAELEACAIGGLS